MLVFYGVGSFFKKNRDSVFGGCGNCDYYGRLLCYDATRCFWVYWVPLIPLGRKHVLGECPKCNSARMMPLKAWRKGRDEEVPAVIERLDASPTDREVVAEALSLSMAYHHRDAFVSVALPIETNFGDDAEMMGELGDGYAFFGMTDEAETAYRTALEFADTSARRSSLIGHLLGTGRAEEAFDLAQPLVDSPDAGAAPGLLMLGETAHNGGRDDLALALFDAAREAMPQFDEDKAFRKLYRKVAKRARRAAKAQAE